MNAVEQRIAVFGEVQNLIYQLSRDGKSDCNCVSKSKLLGVHFSNLDIPWRYRLVEFSWADLGVPEEVMSIEHDTPAVHKYLEAHIPETEQWVIVDPTWDPGLRDVLPVPQWDGLTATELAVPGKQILTEKESETFYANVKSAEYVKGWFQRNNDFMEAINRWLVGCRSDG